MNQIQLRSEQLVLYALLMKPEIVHEIMSKISSDMFLDNVNKIIFETAVSLYVEQKPINVVSLIPSVSSQNSMYKTQVRNEVMSIVSKFTVISWLELDDAIIFLIAESVRHEHESLGSKILEMSKADEYDPTVVLDFLQNHISTNKFKSLVKKKELTNTEMVLALEEQMQKAREKKGISGLETGYYELDEVTTGAQPTNLIIIAARPAMGKSQFALGIFEHLSVKDSKKGIFFSCEMDETQVAKRVICINGKIRGYSVKFGKLDRREHLAFIRSSQAFAESSGKILSRSWHINDIIAKAHEVSNSEGLDYIIVDYIQIVNANGNGSKNSEVEEVTRKLKELANDLKIPVYALSQLSRAVETRPDKKPMLSDLRDSGSIEQDADIVIFLYRPAYYMDFNERQGHDAEKDGYVMIAKHRDGELCDIQLKFESDIPAWMNKTERIPEIEPQEELEFDVIPAMRPNVDFDLPSSDNNDLPF